MTPQLFSLRSKIPQRGICPVPCGLRQCARCFRLSFYQGLSSVKGCLPSKIVFRQRSSSVKGCLPSKVVFRQRSSSVKGRLPSKVVFHHRSSSVRGRLPSKVLFCPRATPEVNQAKWAWSFRQIKPWKKRPESVQGTHRNWHVGPVLTSLALDKNKHNSFFEIW